MSRKELLIAGLLLAVAIVGGASIPRLLASPAAPIGIALGPGPGHSVVQAPPISGAHHRSVSSHSSSRPSRVSAAAVTPVIHAALQPSSSARVTHPTKTKPVTTAPPPATPPTQPPAAAGRNPTLPPAVTPPGQAKTPPGHEKSPPGHLPRASRARPTVTRGPKDLPGSAHGRPVPQAPPHAVGHHDRGVGHLPSAPARPASATHNSRPKARPETRGPRGQGSHGSSAAPQVAQGHGQNENGKGSGD